MMAIKLRAGLRNLILLCSSQACESKLDDVAERIDGLKQATQTFPCLSSKLFYPVLFFSHSATCSVGEVVCEAGQCKALRRRAAVEHEHGDLALQVAPDGPQGKRAADGCLNIYIYILFIYLLLYVYIYICK